MWFAPNFITTLAFFNPLDVGTLEVYVRGDSEFIDDLQPLFIKSGNQGDVWKRGDIYIDKRDEPFQV